MSLSQDKRPKKLKKTEFHCPVEDCLFAEGSERHFSAKKFLDQHIARVHAEKKYPCTKCQKSFGLDIFRKHHEKNCGITWKCDCGSKYLSRESLLTHSRRTQHKLPDYISPVKKHQKKTSSASGNNPVILLIQPIIQNITCTQLHQSKHAFQMPVVTPRRILPKSSQPQPPTLLGTTTSLPVIHDASSVIFNQAEDASLCTSIQPASNSQNIAYASLPAKNCYTEIVTEPNSSTSCHKSSNTVSTQTENETAACNRNVRLSQASQCSRHKPKSMKVGIENQTQTAESAVVKIKKKRSRRKSVAITTETSIATDRIPDSENLFWSGFSDFVNSFGARMFKNSASTQTNTTKNKTVCDSETLTDNDLIKFAWDQTVKLKNMSETTDMDNQMMGNDSLANNDQGLTMYSQNGKDGMNCQIMNCEPSVGDSIQRLGIFSTGKEINSIDLQIMDTDHSVVLNNDNNNNNKDYSIFSQNNVESKLDHVNGDCNIQTQESAHALPDKSQEDCSIFSVFGNSDKSIINNKDSHTSTLDIHTQTMASAVFDYNLLTNMETQTTDDFNFTYLEFSDTETQTPWEDFPSIDDSPLQADQLSIEIQTDFSSFKTDVNFDPNELFNSVDVQNVNVVAGCSSKETANVNTETQTLDGFCFPQFTNTESQTLDISDFLFDS